MTVADSNTRLIFTTDREKAVEMAREAGMGDVDILRLLVRGVYGKMERRRVIVEWGEVLGYGPIESLQLAKSSGLVSTLHLPKIVERLRNRVVDKFDE